MKFALLYEIQCPRPWGASAIELQGFGIDPAETREQWDEALRMIPKMWMEEEFSWDSPRFQMPARNVLPKPRQRPHPPLWMSGTQPDSAVLAGERGIGFMHFSMSDPIGMDQKVRAYREAIARAEPVGAFVNDQFAAFTCMFCGEDDEDARRRAEEPVCWYTNLVDRHSAIVGGPERCVESVRWYESQGVDQMILLVQAGSLGHDDICDSLRRFGREVIPKFR